jgi:hypothetical protein
MWLLDVDGTTTFQFPHLMLCPEKAAPPEPSFPLIGHAFFRHFEPTVRLDFPSFPWNPDELPNQPCGWLEW